MEFRAAPKNAVHFLYGAALHRPGGTPGPPYAVPSLFEIGILITEFSVSGIRGFGSRLLIGQGFLGAKAGFGGFGLGLLGCQSRSFRPVLLPPLQSCFAKDTAFFSAKAQKLKNSAKQNSWIVCRFSPWREVGILNRENLCVTEYLLLLPPSQDVSTRYRSVDMTVLAAFATLVCQIYCFFPAKAQSSRIRRKPNSGTVRRFSPLKPAFFFPNSAQAEFGGFGSRRLISQSFLGAKAPLQSVFAKDTAFLSAKAQNSRIRRSRILGQYAGFSLWNVFPLMEPAV